MKVILREDVADLGAAGQTIEVKDGYGRNYLIPRNLAILATKANLRSIGEIDKQKVVREKKSRRTAEILKDKIEKVELSAEVLVGEEDKLYGSITTQDIVDLLAKQGVTVDRRTVHIEEPIKALGVYSIPVKIEKDVTANCKVWVVKKS
ncbi:MAG: 50S ribosomal protein L9 [candidate division Zixibacteria bacterium]|nr:50S ribosomal protein L9 [candidate division Zixibacteria bacterium]